MSESIVKLFIFIFIVGGFGGGVTCVLSILSALG